MLFARARRRPGPIGCPINSCSKKWKLSRALRWSVKHPGFHSIPGRARIHKRSMENPRQLKPIPCGPIPPQEPAKRGTAIQSWCRSSGSAQRRGSLKPRTHTQDTGSHCCQSNCSPDRDTRWLKENAGASGTTQHRPVFLKRWKAYVTWCSGDLQGQLRPCMY